MLDWGVDQVHRRNHDHDPYQKQQQQLQGCRKGPWTPEEDKLLTEYVTSNGEGRWSSVAKCAGLNRSGKSCRLRWVNYLRPGLKRGQITPQEEGIILELHSLWGLQPQQQNQRSQLVSQDHMNLDNEQNKASSFFYPASVVNDQFHMPQSVIATSSDHSMIDEGNLWGSLWSLNDDDPHRFGGAWEQRTAADIAEKFNGGKIEDPPCGSGEYNYNGFYTGGYTF
ncbi:hypothetical protein Bca4012_059687 [Brassica carinata]